jgi:hypothetical protein
VYFLIIGLKLINLIILNISFSVSFENLLSQVQNITGSLEHKNKWKIKLLSSPLWIQPPFWIFKLDNFVGPFKRSGLNSLLGMPVHWLHLVLDDPAGSYHLAMVTSLGSFQIHLLSNLTTPRSNAVRVLVCVGGTTLDHGAFERDRKIRALRQHHTQVSLGSSGQVFKNGWSIYNAPSCVVGRRM